MRSSNKSGSRKNSCNLGGTIMGDKKPGKGKKKKGDFKGSHKGGPPSQTNVKSGGHQQHSGRGR